MIDRSLAVQVFTRDGWKCRYCGFRETLDPHHIKFASRGGKDELDNLITLCRSCHDGIHAGGLVVTNEAGKITFRRIGKWKP